MEGDEYVWAGIDVGSRSTEAVILNEEGVLASSIIPTGAESAKTALRAMEKALEPLHPISLQDIRYVIATGYGRVVVPFAHENISELSCHARGAQYLLPSVRTILDIGGQDCKVIRCDDKGNMVDFVMNDKCAAGTGRFLEIIARSLQVPLERIGELSLKATKGVAISSRCAVFGKSEALSLNRSGVPKEEILAGVHQAVCERAMELLSRVGMEEDFVMTGGVAKNLGVVKMIENKLGKPFNILPEPEIVGALGAALFARGKWVLQEPKFSAIAQKNR
jgi:predicted CoA-substrate-specific enzyme activase